MKTAGIFFSSIDTGNGPLPGIMDGLGPEEGSPGGIHQPPQGGMRTPAFQHKWEISSVLPKIKYVITLDADTNLPRDVAKRLVGTLAHPLNRPIVDKTLNRVVKGYGVLQPRIGVSVDSASRSSFALTFSGQTG